VTKNGYVARLGAGTVARMIGKSVKSLPMCWDTPRAGTNEEYFDL
jgi:hypothetical protein